MKVVVYHENVYGSTVRFVVGTHEEYVRYVRRLTGDRKYGLGDEDFPGTFGYSEEIRYSHKGRFNVFWMVWLRKEKLNMGSMMHETMHTVLSLCRYFSLLDPSLKSDEPAAYLMESIVCFAVPRIFDVRAKR